MMVSYISLPGAVVMCSVSIRTPALPSKLAPSLARRMNTHPVALLVLMGASILRHAMLSECSAWILRLVPSSMLVFEMAWTTSIIATAQCLLAMVASIGHLVRRAASSAWTPNIRLRRMLALIWVLPLTSILRLVWQHKMGASIGHHVMQSAFSVWIHSQQVSIDIRCGLSI